MRILLVEDEVELATLLAAALARERYVVDIMDSVGLAREAAANAVYDFILLDRTLPDGEGMDLIPSFRAGNPGVPVMVLSARGDSADRIEGLNGGADDYLAKPFATEELLARIRAVKRRRPDLAIEEVRVGNLTYHPEHEEVIVGDLRLDLPRRELRVLAALVRRRGRTVLRRTLEEAVYGFDDEIQSNSLDSHVSRLRRRLTDAGSEVEIHAIRGVGYLLRPAG